MLLSSRIPIVMLAMLTFSPLIFTSARGAVALLPPPQAVEWGSGVKTLQGARIVSGDPALLNETQWLINFLKERGIALNDNGTPITMKVAPVNPPGLQSRYKDRITSQAYQLSAGASGIVVTGASPAGVFHGLQTLAQLINDQNSYAFAEITDWPDLAVRMLMIDPARQNENFEYYRRFIRFAARYKINTILCHLTDDQTSTLHHEDYPELMHPQAWTTEQIVELREFAGRHHIELIPEIESFGHSRMFTRREDFRDFLHQTKSDKPTMSWVGTSVPGWTNVLCPASPKAAAYLDAMYGRAQQGFTHPWLHIGFDEVDITECDRCRAAFGEQTAAEWIATQLHQCRELVEKRGKTLALWGDMILKHPEALNDLPTTNTIIFDWHYNHDVTSDSVALFQSKGFQVVACPALVCAPHMILPDWHNFENIERFTRIAREHDLLGVNTTIWIPARYMSDVLWPGIAFAAGQSWGGSRWDDAAYYEAFVRDHWGSDKGAEFMRAWESVTAIDWHRGDFVTSCWINEENLAAAFELAAEKGAAVKEYLTTINAALDTLNSVTPAIRKNQVDWHAAIRSVQLLRYTMRHLMAAPDVRGESGWNADLIRELDEECQTAIRWIEEDWNRNRYPNDPNMYGLYLTNQHLLYQFNEMHKFHQQIINRKNNTP